LSWVRDTRRLLTGIKMIWNFVSELCGSAEQEWWALSEFSVRLCQRKHLRSKSFNLWNDNKPNI